MTPPNKIEKQKPMNIYKTKRTINKHAQNEETI